MDTDLVTHAAVVGLGGARSLHGVWYNQWTAGHADVQWLWTAHDGRAGGHALTRIVVAAVFEWTADGR